MANTCTICRHAERDSIDRALVSDRPFRHIAERYGVSTSSLVRHRESHIPDLLVAAEEIRRKASADGLLAHLGELQARTMRILDKAEAEGDYKAALAAIGQAGKQVELLVKLKQIDDQNRKMSGTDPLAVPAQPSIPARPTLGPVEFPTVEAMMPTR